MGGSEQPVRCTRKTHSKLGRSGTGCGLSPGSMLPCQRSARAHLQRVSLPGKVTFKCRSSDFGEGCPWFQPTFPAPRSPRDDLKGLVQLKWFYESIIFLRLCFMGWIRSHHWMKIRCPFMSTWFWKDLEEHKLNFPGGRNFLLRITAAYTPQFVQAVTQPPRSVLSPRKIERLRGNTVITFTEKNIDNLFFSIVWMKKEIKWKIK